MAPDARALPRQTTEQELVLPPPFTPVRLRELGDAFAHACAVAAESGAGTLVHVGRFDLAEFALVLEPEEPLREARRVFYAGMAALADALVAHAQPETSVTIDWPDSIAVNGGLVGGGRLAWPAGVGEDETPPWLVFGAMVRTVSMTDADPGLNPLVTVLEEEGFSGTTTDSLVESFARHFMVALDAWKVSGFDAVARSYIEWLPRVSGLRRDIDANGDLTLRRVGKAEIQRRKFLPALVAPSWYDPVAKGPRTS
jgi:biotin-(acetyl-CoA carboxylase) ligase